MSVHAVLPIEHDLLVLTRAVVGLWPAAAVHPLLVRSASADDRVALERGLTPGAKSALQQILAKGLTSALLRRGGWRRDLRLAGGALRRTRLWETSPAPLELSASTFTVARWLTLEAVDRADGPPVAPAGSGDELFMYLVCALFDELRIPLVRLAPVVSRSSFAQLAFVDALGDDAGEPPASFGETLVAMPVLLGGMASDLARSLVRLERKKARMSDPQELARLSALAEARLGAVVNAAHRSGRLELLRFVTLACEELLRLEGTSAELDPRATLRARQAARVASRGTLRVASRVAELHDALRHVGFVDDGYEEAQALLSAWEQEAPALERARALAAAPSVLAGDLLGERGP